jgi:hypothetical protein
VRVGELGQMSLFLLPTAKQRVEGEDEQHPNPDVIGGSAHEATERPSQRQTDQRHRAPK